MDAVLFALRRPWLLLRDVLLDRERPDLDRLRALHEPDRFLWAILPHAARTFSACIAMLPARSARAAAVGYLYCRILDTYEDLHPDPVDALRVWTRRLDSDPLPPAPPIPSVAVRDARDKGHLLLVERCALVDDVFARLAPGQRAAIRELVRSMAEGMAWSSAVFRRQGGVLEGEEQLARYCRNVLGYPVVFTLRLLGGDLSPAIYEDGMRVGEMVQLANVTRDIEKDLARGIAYDARLKPHLGEVSADRDQVREVREDLLRMALRRAPAYRRMVEAMALPRLSLARASAVLMLLFTDRYYRSCARRVGWRPWRGSGSTFVLFCQMLPALWSPGYTRRLLARIERSFTESGSTPR